MKRLTLWVLSAVCLFGWGCCTEVTPCTVDVQAVVNILNDLLACLAGGGVA